MPNNTNGNAAHVVFSTADELGIVNSNFKEDVIATSAAQYVDCNAEPDHICRWGDYSATTIDPLNPNRAWSINQIATGTSFRKWATTTGAVDVPPPPTPVQGGVGTMKMQGANQTRRNFIRCSLTM